MLDCKHYCFHIINLLMAVTGALCICFAVWFSSIKMLQQTVKNGKQDQLFFFFSIGIGTALVLIAFIGSLGLFLRKKIFLQIYSLLIIFFATSELVAFIYTITQGVPAFVKSLAVVWRALSMTSKDIIQIKFSCCGYLNATEWKTPYPKSCFNSTSSLNNTTLDQLWKKSCSQQIFKWLTANMAILAAAIVTIFVVQIIQVVISTLLILSLKNFNNKRKHSLQERLDDEVFEADTLPYDKSQKHSGNTLQWQVDDGNMEYVRTKPIRTQEVSQEAIRNEQNFDQAEQS